MIPLAEYWERKDPSSWEYKDLAPIAVLVSSNVKIKCFGNEHSQDEAAGTIVPIPSSYLRDSCSTAIAPVLRHYLKQASWQKFLHCGHWRHENETS